MGENKLMRKEDRKRTAREIVQLYIDYVRANHADPSSKEFTAYYSVTRGDDEAENWKKHFKTISELRLAAIQEDETILEEVLNDAELNTTDYREKVLEAVRTHRTFIVTTAVNGKACHVDFYKALKNYASRNGAAILLIPSEDVKNSKKQFKWNFDPIFKDSYFVMSDTRLNNNLLISGITISAKQKNPLTGLEVIAGKNDCSIITSGTKQLLKNIPTYNGGIPNSLMCTGAVTVADYTNDYMICKRTSYIAEIDHQVAALIVEVENDRIFHYRQIQACKDGSFTDLGVKYNADGSTSQSKNAVLVMGDSHVGSHDGQLFGKVLDMLAQEDFINTVVLHDICDSGSVSHHESEDYVKRAQRMRDGSNILNKDVDAVAEYLNDLTEFEDLEVVVVNSNHDNHIERYVREGRAFKDKDFNNIELSCQMFCGLVDETIKNPLQFLVNYKSNVKLKKPGAIKWLALDESYKKHGVELGFHGHTGANGGRASLRTFENSIYNAVLAHTHSGGIRCNIFQVGTTSELKMGYNVGLSSWTRTCCLCYEDGTKQLINFIPTQQGYKYSVRRAFV